MATDTGIARRTSSGRGTARLSAPGWPSAAWGAVAVAIVFVAVTCWWLSRDRSIPIDDAGVHLSTTISVYEALSAGRLLKAFTEAAPYPPLTFLAGALGIFLGGVDVAPPIIALNLVFVPLLALGCYKVGRLAFGPSAGLLAVVFALGSPLVVEEFHELMLDAPEAALVALAVWAILATERFSRPGPSALAGAAVGAGMLSKETFVLFVAGVALVTAARGGRRAWRGIAAFVAAILVIALPWYVYELSTIHQLEGEALGSSGQVSTRIPGIAPPRLSSANLEWYFWSFLNWQLLLPLFVFAATGWVWTIVGFARRRPVSRFAVELVVGAFSSWAAITLTYVHDPRYGMPMIVYLAVFGACWIARLPRLPRAVAATALATAALANVLGVGLGLGHPVATAPTSLDYEQQPDRAMLYASYGLWMGPPSRDGDLLGLLRALRRAGTRAVGWYLEAETDTEFSPPGVAVLARIAGLATVGAVDPARAGSHEALLLHRPAQPGLPPPCIELSDGSGVWVGLGGPGGVRTWSYCPTRSA